MAPNQALQQTGHANDGCARHAGFFRVSRLLSLVFGFGTWYIAGSLSKSPSNLGSSHSWKRASPAFFAKIVCRNTNKGQNLRTRSLRRASTTCDDGGNHDYYFPCC